MLRDDNSATRHMTAKTAASGVVSRPQPSRKRLRWSEASLGIREVDISLYQPVNTFHSLPSSCVLYGGRTATAYVSHPDKPSHRSNVASNTYEQLALFSYMHCHTATRCALPSCARHTYNLSTTAICPACGPYSYVRYCSVGHLHDDIRRHYRLECGRRLNPLLLDELTMTTPVQTRRPFVPCLNAATNDSLERHRQAIFCATPAPCSTTGCYAVFTDLDLLWDSKDTYKLPTIALLNNYRGRGEVCAVVEFENHKRQRWFEKSLQTLLSLGQAAKDYREQSRGRLIVLDVYRATRDNLRSQTKWDTKMSDRVRFAMALEFGWRVPISEW